MFFFEQLDAIKQGLLKVIPQAVLDLLTWQELEARVCGNPEINVENLKRTSEYIRGQSSRVVNFSIISSVMPADIILQDQQVMKLIVLVKNILAWVTELKILR